MGSAIVAGAAVVGKFVAAYGTTIAAASAVVSAGVAYKTNEDNKDSQEAYNEALSKEAIRQYGELDKAESDAIYESHASSMQAQREYMSAKSQVQLQASATGTQGQSIALAIQDLNTGLGGRMADITYKRESQMDAIDQKAESIRVNPSMNADTSIQMPSYYAAFSSGLSTFSKASAVTSKVTSAYNQVKPASS